MLLVEAVVASFLLIFGFLASASLYDASLRWEAGTINIQRATLLAERKMEEIRALAAIVPTGSTFAARVDSLTNVTGFTYPDSPDFPIDVTRLANTHLEVASSGLTPTNGVHSPCSTFYTEPTNSASTGRSTAPYASDPGGDYQKNGAYETFPYSRSMANTYRLVKVSVGYGPRPDQKVDLVSLIGDPILPPDRPSGGNLDRTLKVVKLGGDANLTAAGSHIDFGIEVTTRDGSKVDDVAALWSVYALSDGTADIFPLDALGTKVRLTRNAQSRSGTFVRLYPQIRYEGIEARALSENIAL